MPTHRDFPWERDARAAASGADSGGEGLSPSPEGAAYGRRPPERGRPRVVATRKRRAGTGLRRPLGAGEIAALLLVAAVGIVLAASRKDHNDRGIPGLGRTSAAPSSPTRRAPSAARPPAVAGTVTDLHSRFVGRSRLEAWGSVRAPDGTTVSLVIQGAAGRRAVRAPAVAGRFYAAIHVPARWQGQRLSVRAQVGR